MKTFKQFQEQLTPGKSYLPQDTDQMHFDDRKPGDKLRKLQMNVKYYGGYPPKGPK